MSNRWLTPQDELYHHGIKGQRWGVRRFQNPDGSLTPRGKARVRKIYAKNDQSEWFNNLQEHKKVSGIVVGEDHDIIRKGSTLGRFSSTDKEVLGKRRAYAFLTESDRKDYYEMAKSGFLDFASKDVYEYTLTAKRDLKVARGEEVVDYMIQRWGNALPQDGVSSYRASKDIRSIAPGLRPKDVKKSKDAAFLEKLTDGRQKFGDLVNKIMALDTPLSSAVFDHFKELGYDAIVDPGDSWTLRFRGTEYPVMLLTPSEAVSIVKVNKV